MTEHNHKMALHFEVSGHFTLSTNKRGKVAEFTNLITNAGLNNLTDARWHQSAFVGTGSTPPNVNDTNLAAYLSHSNPSSGKTTSTVGVSSSAPYYCYMRATYRFAVGEAAGNLTEIGVGWRGTSVNNLICRTLIKDANGDPTALTILSDEILDVTYELRQYIPTEDVTGTITFGGNIGGTYAYTLRPSRITTAGYGNVGGWGGSNQFAVVPSTTWTYAYTGGGLGTIFSSPSGNSLNFASSVNSPSYVQDSYTSTLTYTFGVDTSNHVNGISCFRFYLGNGAYQIKFDPPIPKTASDALSFTVSYSWGRKA